MFYGLDQSRMAGKEGNLRLRIRAESAGKERAPGANSMKAFLILISLFLLVCTGCGELPKPENETQYRFTSEQAVEGTFYYAVVTDTKTGKKYLHGTNGGFVEIEK